MTIKVSVDHSIRSRRSLRGHVLHWLLTPQAGAVSLFLGGCMLIAWLGPGLVLIICGSWTPAFAYIFQGVVYSPYAPLIGIAGIRWGWRVLRGVDGRRNWLIAGLRPALLLSPLLVIIGFFMPQMSRILLHNVLLPERVEISALAPVGLHVASAVRKLTLGGWGEDYLVESEGERRKVGGTGDFNKVKKIHWSPDSEYVLFQKPYSILLVRAKDWTTSSVTIRWQTTTTRAGPIDLETISFPASGKITIRYRDGILTEILS